MIGFPVPELSKLAEAGKIADRDSAQMLGNVTNQEQSISFIDYGVLLSASAGKRSMCLLYIPPALTLFFNNLQNTIGHNLNPCNELAFIYVITLHGLFTNLDGDILIIH